MMDVIEKDRPSTFGEKAIGGLVAGGLGSIVGTPADLALIRMQADATLPVEQRRHYTGVFNALARITKEEGPAGLFKGCTPVVVRAMALNAGMLASHDQVQAEMKKITDNYWLQVRDRHTTGLIGKQRLRISILIFSCRLSSPRTSAPRVCRVSPPPPARSRSIS